MDDKQKRSERVNAFHRLPHAIEDESPCYSPHPPPNNPSRTMSKMLEDEDNEVYKNQEHQYKKTDNKIADNYEYNKDSGSVDGDTRNESIDCDDNESEDGEVRNEQQSIHQERHSQVNQQEANNTSQLSSSTYSTNNSFSHSQYSSNYPHGFNQDGGPKISMYPQVFSDSWNHLNQRPQFDDSHPDSLHSHNQSPNSHSNLLGKNSDMGIAPIKVKIRRDQEMLEQQQQLPSHHPQLPLHSRQHPNSPHQSLHSKSPHQMQQHQLPHHIQQNQLHPMPHQAHNQPPHHLQQHHQHYMKQQKDLHLASQQPHDLFYHQQHHRDLYRQQQQHFPPPHQQQFPSDQQFFPNHMFYNHINFQRLSDVNSEFYMNEQNKQAGNTNHDTSNNSSNNEGKRSSHSSPHLSKILFLPPTDSQSHQVQHHQPNFLLNQQQTPLSQMQEQMASTFKNTFNEDFSHSSNQHQKSHQQPQQQTSSMSPSMPLSSAMHVLHGNTPSPPHLPYNHPQPSPTRPKTGRAKTNAELKKQLMEKRAVQSRPSNYTDDSSNSQSPMSPNHEGFHNSEHKGGHNIMRSATEPQRSFSGGVVGDLVWVRKASTCYWPAIISFDASTGTFYKMESMGNTPSHMYHVAFFSTDETDRGWFEVRSVLPFMGKEAFQLFCERMLEENKKDRKAFKVPILKKKLWEACVRACESIVGVSAEERCRQLPSNLQPLFVHKKRGRKPLYSQNEAEMADEGKKMKKEKKAPTMSHAIYCAQPPQPPPPLLQQPQFHPASNPQVTAPFQPTEPCHIVLPKNISNQLQAQFTVFCRKKRDSVVAMYPSWSPQQVDAHLATLWQGLDDETRSRFIPMGSDFTYLSRMMNNNEDNITNDNNLNNNQIHYPNYSHVNMLTEDDKLIDNNNNKLLPLHPASITTEITKQPSVAQPLNISNKTSNDNNNNSSNNNDNVCNNFSDNNNNTAVIDEVCFVCEKPDNQTIIQCQGPCRNLFHPSCIGVHTPSTSPIVCPCCVANKHKCGVCMAEVGQELLCSVPDCGRFYHKGCVEGVLFKGDKLICPLHSCATCRIRGKLDDVELTKADVEDVDLYECIRCCQAFHIPGTCLSIGSKYLAGNFVVCGRHFEANVRLNPLHAKVSTNWCSKCQKGGGTLLNCDTCPSSYHSGCLASSLSKTPSNEPQSPSKQPQAPWRCLDCLKGLEPLYGDIVWVKFGSYRWWPAQIYWPYEVPQNIKELQHSIGDFPVFFFGSRDYLWLNRGRVIAFKRGDKCHKEAQKKSGGKVFDKALKEALALYDQISTEVHVSNSPIKESDVAKKEDKKVNKNKSVKKGGGESKMKKTPVAKNNNQSAKSLRLREKVKEDVEEEEKEKEDGKVVEHEESANDGDNDKKKTPKVKAKKSAAKPKSKDVVEKEEKQNDEVEEAKEELSDNKCPQTTTDPITTPKSPENKSKPETQKAPTVKENPKYNEALKDFQQIHQQLNKNNNNSYNNASFAGLLKLSRRRRPDSVVSTLIFKPLPQGVSLPGVHEDKCFWCGGSGEEDEGEDDKDDGLDNDFNTESKTGLMDEMVKRERVADNDDEYDDMVIATEDYDGVDQSDKEGVKGSGNGDVKVNSGDDVGVGSEGVNEENGVKDEEKKIMNDAKNDKMADDEVANKGEDEWGKTKDKIETKQQNCIKKNDKKDEGDVNEETNEECEDASESNNVGLNGASPRNTEGPTDVNDIDSCHNDNNRDTDNNNNMKIKENSSNNNNENNNNNNGKEGVIEEEEIQDLSMSKMNKSDEKKEEVEDGEIVDELEEEDEKNDDDDDDGGVRLVNYDDDDDDDDDDDKEDLVIDDDPKFGDDASDVKTDNIDINGKMSNENNTNNKINEINETNDNQTNNNDTKNNSENANEKGDKESSSSSATPDGTKAKEHNNKTLLDATSQSTLHPQSTNDGEVAGVKRPSMIMLHCDKVRCPKVYHLSCLKLSKLPHGAWLCPWHHCSICGRSSTHQCSQCPNAFCLHHFPHHLSYLNNGSPICTSHPEAPPICPDQVNAILTEMAEVKEGLINKEGSLTHGSKDRNSVKEKDDKKGAKDQNKKKRLKSSSEEEDEEDEGAYECRESDKKKKNNKESPVKVDRKKDKRNIRKVTKTSKKSDVEVVEKSEENGKYVEEKNKPSILGKRRNGETPSKVWKIPKLSAKKDSNTDPTSLFPRQSPLAEDHENVKKFVKTSLKRPPIRASKGPSTQHSSSVKHSRSAANTESNKDRNEKESSSKKLPPPSSPDKSPMFDHSDDEFPNLVIDVPV